MQKWFIALLLLGALVALLGPLRMIAADRYRRAEQRPEVNVAMSRTADSQLLSAARRVDWGTETPREAMV